MQTAFSAHEALIYYADQYCEGWCKENGGYFDDCGGCRARRVLEAQSDDSSLLALVRQEATKFGRCCDFYQDGFGTFADHECQQRTFAMLRSVQQVLGVNKGGSPLSETEVAAATARAHLNNAAHAMKEALEALIAQHDRPHGFDDAQWYAPQIASARDALALSKS